MIMNRLNDSNECELTTSDHDPLTILCNSSPQVQELLKLIHKTSQEKNNVKGLIFVQKRYTARIICHIIRRYFDTEENAHLNVHVDFMTGRNSYMPDSIETVISNKNNNEVLDKFKRGQINFIVATSVLEEGIDLQDCNLVIRYDVPQTFRAYVQSKGRARMKDSIYAILTPANEFEKVRASKAEWNTVSKILEKVCDTYFIPPPN